MNSCSRLVQLCTFWCLHPHSDEISSVKFLLSSWKHKADMMLKGNELNERVIRNAIDTHMTAFHTQGMGACGWHQLFLKTTIFQPSLNTPWLKATVRESPFPSFETVWLAHLSAATLPDAHKFVCEWKEYHWSLIQRNHTHFHQEPGAPHGWESVSKCVQLWHHLVATLKYTARKLLTER